MSMKRASASSRRRHFIAAAAGAISLAMLGLAFAAAPLYRLYCAATGYAGTPQIAKALPATKGMRSLTVRFDANVAPGLPWSFVPETVEIKLRTGEMATIYYRIANKSDRATVARAAFNVSPDSAGAYFDKVACFCFNEQKLDGAQALELPVVFYLDPALEKDPAMSSVSEITLSYTFFAEKPASSTLAVK